MKLHTLVSPPKKGDMLLLQGHFGNGEPKIQLLKVKEVKVSENDGTEIILQKKGNCYFNWEMYVDDKSWVNEVCFVTP